MNKITAIVSAFNRPKQLENLIKSIKNHYPEMPIIVADNGESGFVPSGVDYHRIKFDSGLSYSRNFMLDQIKTEYFLLLDDDFVFDERTDIGKMEEALDAGMDLVGGSVDGLEYNGLIDVRGTELFYVKGARGEYEGYPLYDMVLNFFMARTDKIKAIRWDEELKLAEHTDFFLRAKGKLRITFLPDVIVGHDQVREGDYAKYRARGNHFTQVFMKKHGITKLINFTGAVTELRTPAVVKKEKRGNDTKFVDFCITTFKRPQALKRLMMSIAKEYPMANVYVADQNEKFDREFYKELRREVMEAGLIKRPSFESLPYDCGLSYARNHLMLTTPNKYKLILDDDFIFTPATDIGKMVKILDADPTIGLVGGKIRQLGQDISFEFNLEVKDGTLYHRDDGNPYKKIGDIQYRIVECVMNFAVIRKEVFNYTTWDQNLKVNEHLDFFLRFKNNPYKVAYTPQSIMDHTPAPREADYKPLRQRQEFLIYMMRKHKLNRIKYLTGQVNELLPDGSIKRYKETPQPFQPIG